MSSLNAKETLLKLKEVVRTRTEEVVQLENQRRYGQASDKLSELIGHMNRELNLAHYEWFGPSENFASAQIPSDIDIDREVLTLNREMVDQLEVLKTKKDLCEDLYTQRKLELEGRRLNLKNEEIAIKGRQEQEYVANYKKLIALKKQFEPLKGIEHQLNNLLTHVVSFKKNQEVPVPELTEVMEAAYQNLTSGSSEELERVAKKLNNKNSVPLKILGTLLITLSFVLALSALIFFPPALVTAPLLGILTTYTATAAATTALCVSGVSFFNKHPASKALSEDLNLLNHRELEQHHYETVGNGL